MAASRALRRSAVATNTLAELPSAPSSMTGLRPCSTAADVLVLVGIGNFRIDQLASFTGFENIRLHNATNDFANVAIGSQPIEVDATGYSLIQVHSPSNRNSSDIINGNPLGTWVSTDLYFDNNSQSYPPPPVTYDLTANGFSMVSIFAGADNVSLCKQHSRYTFGQRYRANRHCHASVRSPLLPSARHAAPVNTVHQRRLTSGALP
jgi:hypothetical protein